jgi:hypothetical protein
MAKSAARARSVVPGLLAAALIVGAALRLLRLARVGLSPDEAASWAAASGRSLAAVVHTQAALNPGKLALNDLLLHAWIGFFNDGTAALRSLPALIGVGAILLVFWASRRIVALDEPEDGSAEGSIGAICALIFAVTLVMIKYAREARMYSLMLAMVLAQVSCLLGARRRGGILNYGGTVLFTALAIAANFTAGAAFAAQAAWLAFAPALAGDASRKAARLKALAAIAAGGLLLAPLSLPGLVAGVRVLDAGALRWIAPPRFYEPFSLFNKGAGTLPFPLLLALSLWGAIAGWNRMRAAVIFALCWMLGPVLLLMAISLFRPMLTERYVLSSFVPWFFLAALGIHYCGSRRWQWMALGLLIVLSLAHSVAFLQKPVRYPWAPAARAAAEYGGAQAVVVVSPDYAASVVRYQLRHDGSRVIGLQDAAACGRAQVLVSWNHLLSGPEQTRLRECRARFSHFLFRQDDVSVLSR